LDRDINSQFIDIKQYLLDVTAESQCSIFNGFYYNVYGSFHGQEYFLVSSEIFTNLTSAFCFNREPEQSSGLLLPERSAKMVVLSKLVNHAAGFLPVPMVVLQAGTHTLHLVAENLPRDVGGRFRKVTQD